MVRAAFTLQRRNKDKAEERVNKMSDTVGLPWRRRPPERGDKVYNTTSIITEILHAILRQDLELTQMLCKTLEPLELELFKRMCPHNTGTPIWLEVQSSLKWTSC